MPLPFLNAGGAPGSLWPVTNLAGTPNALSQGVGVSLAQLLFGAGEDGFLFGNFAELDELFKSDNGSTGTVAANDDSVGLAMDDHSWGASTLALIVAAQADLVSNGGFDSDTVWSKGAGWAIAAGKATNAATGSNSDLSETITLSAGKVYAVTYTLSSVSAGTITAALNGAVAASSAAQTANGTYTDYITAPDSPTSVRFRANSAFNGSIDNVSVKLVPGNHALQATNSKRPLWKANSGKPYLSFDGGDDRIITPFIPTAAVTLACAARFSTTSVGVQSATMGGGVSTGNKRCFIGCLSSSDAVGKLSPGWGTETIGTNSFGPDIRDQDHVVVLTGDAVSRDLWLDGVLLDSRSPAGTGPDGTGGGVALGQYNNDGSVSLSLTGNVYAALALNRRASAAEIARITSDFQRTYQ